MRRTVLSTVLILILFVLSCVSMPQTAEEFRKAAPGPSIAIDRLLVEARVNSQPVRLAFDTGAQYTVLNRQSARRIGLSITDPPTDAKLKPGEVPFGLSEECDTTVFGVTTRRRLPIFDHPDYIKSDVDGVLGWADVRNSIFWVFGDTKEVTALPVLQKDIDVWSEWTIRQDSPILALKLSESSQPEGTILIDTGSPLGVELSRRRWKDWRQRHKDQPCTLSAVYDPYAGIGVYEECWAENLVIGRLSLKNVPVRQCRATQHLLFTDFEASLGLFALTRLKVIVDGKTATVYTRPISKPTSKYQYNRMGAVFVPMDVKSSHLVAHVAKKGPAQEAGIRDGDILLSIGDLDVTNWQTDPKVLPLSRFSRRPAKTKLDLSLLRDGKPFKVRVELKEIFPQGSVD